MAIGSKFEHILPKVVISEGEKKPSWFNPNEGPQQDLGLFDLFGQINGAGGGDGESFAENELGVMAIAICNLAGKQFHDASDFLFGNLAPFTGWAMFSID